MRLHLHLQHLGQLDHLLGIIAVHTGEMEPVVASLFYQIFGTRHGNTDPQRAADVVLAQMLKMEVETYNV